MTTIPYYFNTLLMPHALAKVFSDESHTSWWQQIKMMITHHGGKVSLCLSRFVVHHHHHFGPRWFRRGCRRIVRSRGRTLIVLAFALDTDVYGAVQHDRLPLLRAPRAVVHLPKEELRPDVHPALHVITAHLCKTRNSQGHGQSERYLYRLSHKGLLD